MIKLTPRRNNIVDHTRPSIARRCETEQRNRVIATVAAVIGILMGIGLTVQAQTKTGILTQAKKENSKMNQAKGTFDIQMHPEKADNPRSETAAIGRMTSEKQFHGDLEGTSIGEMLFAGTAVEGSQGYVAVEKVSGILIGKTGTFVLLHRGTMSKDAMHMSVTVLPDSGTDQLTGIDGTLTITIVEGKHHFDFEYVLP